mmetsp:Transcript_116159/g.375329  ORF Transcript_116159/g.375329 Transcript_116159/m.375329 type:complete len:729 (+) Transcript_116159:223-2409(+)
MDALLTNMRGTLRSISETVDGRVRDLVQWIDPSGAGSSEESQPWTPARGDAVHVWSKSNGRWIEDGVVQEVIEAELIADGARIPAGSVKVVFRGGTGTKWVLPGQFLDVLRRAPAEPAALATAVAPEGMMAELHLVLQKCQQAGGLFTDPLFTPSMRGQVRQWCRPQEIARHDGQTLKADESWNPFAGATPAPPPADWQLFRGKPRADDVLQGELGDCWFLSSLAALAEFQGGRFVRALLPEQARLSREGAYLVRLCLGGRWRGILVDDRLPCIGGGAYYTQLGYCVTRRLQLWASLIEKGFAKACGSYEALVGGEASEALSVFTGWPCSMIIFHRRDFNPDLLWAALCSSRDAAFLMTCSTKDVKSPSLVPDHVYTLMDLFELPGDAAGDQVRLLKIRNPHEKTKWQGAWSDASPLWTPQLRRQLGCPEGGTPGVFFMALDDFLQQFAHCTICKIRNTNWFEGRHPVRLPSADAPNVGLVLEASETAECSLSLVQPEERVRQGPFFKDLREALACIGFVLLCTDDPGTDAAAAHMRRRNAVSTDCWIQPARSYLLVPLCLHTGSPLVATLACVSSRPVALRERRMTRDEVRAAWASYARKNATRSEQCHGAVLHLGNAGGGSVVALAENRGQGYFNVELSLKCEGVHFSRGRSVTNDWVPPGHAQILQVVQPTGTGDFPSWKSMHKFGVTTKTPSGIGHCPPLSAGDHDLHAPFRVPEPGSAACRQQ